VGEMVCEVVSWWVSRRRSTTRLWFNHHDIIQSTRLRLRTLASFVSWPSPSAAPSLCLYVRPSLRLFVSLTKTYVDSDDDPLSGKQRHDLQWVISAERRFISDRQTHAVQSAETRYTVYTLSRQTHELTDAWRSGQIVTETASVSVCVDGRPSLGCFQSVDRLSDEPWQ